jgi:hypothetical protein
MGTNKRLTIQLNQFMSETCYSTEPAPRTIERWTRIGLVGRYSSTDAGGAGLKVMGGYPVATIDPGDGIRGHAEVDTVIAGSTSLFKLTSSL